MRYPNRNRDGAIGTRTTVKRDGVVVKDESKKRAVPTSGEGLTHSVGTSASIGHGRDYGSSKFEVACWVTMPCAPGAENSVLDECRSVVYERLTAMRDEVAEQFFPDIDSW